MLADIHFDLVGGDDRVRDRWIQVVDSPAISSMTLDCRLPDYIGRKPLRMPVSGVIQIPTGASVTVRASANKRLARVIGWLEGHRRTTARTLEHSELTSDRRGFAYALEPLTGDTTLLLSLTDTDGITSREPVRLAMVALPDEPPQMNVQLDGIGTAVTPRARIPVVGRVTDDYGLARLWFEGAAGQTKPGRHPIRQFSDRPTEFALKDVALEVHDLGAAQGQKLLLSMKAADLCDLGHGPNVAGSEQWSLDVVAPEQLRVMLDARELILRQRFEATVQEMTETRDLLARLEFGPSSATKPLAKGSEPGDEPDDSPARQSTLRLLRVQGALTNCRKSAQEVLGVADAFDDIRKQLVNNRIDTEELKNRLKAGIADPLRQIAERMFPELEKRLELLQPALDDPGHGPRLRDRAQQQADAILLSMQKVLGRMIELEDFNQAVDLLRDIIKMQEQLNDQTRQQHKDKLRDLLKE